MDSHSNVCLDLKVCGRTTKVKCGNGRRAVGTVDNDFQEPIESNNDSHRHRQTSNCIFEAVLGCTQLSCLAPHFLSFFLAVRPASCSFTCPKESGEMGNAPLVYIHVYVSVQMYVLYIQIMNMNACRSKTVLVLR